MTTPNQPIPDNTPATQGLGDGAFEIGGGSTGFGQGIDVNFVKMLFELPAATFGNMLQLLEQALMKLPLAALEAFKAIIPDWVEDGIDNVAAAVAKIISVLDPRRIPQYVDDFLHWAEHVFQPVADLVNSLVDTIVPALSGAVNGVIAFVLSIVNAIIQGIRGIPLVGNGIANILQGLTGTVNAQQVQAQNFTISALTSNYRNPAWVSRYPIADVSYPESLNLRYGVSGVTEAQSAGTTHTHLLNFNNVKGEAGAGGLAAGQAAGAILTIGNTVVFDTVAMALQTSSAAPTVKPTHAYIQIFRETAGGGFTQIFQSPNIGPSIFQYNDTSGPSQYLEVALPNPIIAQLGERYMVRAMNDSTTTAIFSALGVEQSAFPLDTSAAFAAITSAYQTTYTAAEIASALDGYPRLPWAMLACKNIAEAEVSFSDDFNRSFLGPEWYTDGIVVNVGRAAYGGSTNGTQKSLYIRRTTRDASKVSANIYIDAAASTQRAAVRLHGDREGAQSVELSVTGTDAKIYSYAGTTATQRATVAVGGTAFYSLYYDGPNDKYVALKDGATFGLEWTGVSTAISHGPDYRFGGLRISRASGVNAATIDNFTLSDFA